MKSGEMILQSPLEKPLGELTEEDISQLTREDCRKYLKEKGMRRPSWNKSQAIQQVLSLKALVESRTEDSGDFPAGIRQKFLLPGTENQAHNACPPSDPSNSSGADLPVPVSASESISYRRKDPFLPDLTGDSSGIFPATGKGPFSLENNSISPRDPETTDEFVGQMTIFYCGKVNVYDRMPSNKARAIMQIAGTPNCTPYDAPSAGDPFDRPVPCRFPVACVKPGLSSPQPAVISPHSQTEGPTSRKASLQRYLEKRKDRFKGRRKMVGSSSSSLEVYLNNPMRGQTPNRQSSGSGTCSPTRPRPPHTPVRCSSVENQAKNLCLSVDLNGDEIPEA